jgi:hypothetical protein
LCQAKHDLVGGSAAVDIMRVGPLQRRAIGRVWPAKGPRGFFCTGVRVASNWVLTANHCDLGGGSVFELPATETEPAIRLQGVELISHAQLDALLIRFDDAPDGAALRLISDSIDNSWIDTPVQLAGYGVMEDGRVAKELEFLAERIAEVDADWVVVDGQGRTGACGGDSGGPLLARDFKGELVVIGILSSGSASCRDIDRYVRGDRLRDWVWEQTHADPRFEEDCATIGQQGFCRRGTAVWCDANKVRAQHCEAASTCGWDTAAGYRCVQPNEDACDGVDDLGACAGNMVRRCEAGRTVEQPCGACGLACAWDATRGRFDCLEE